MFNIRYLKILVLLSLTSAGIIPCYLALHVTPAFQQQIIDETENEARRVAAHLASMHFQGPDNLISRQALAGIAESDAGIRQDFHLKKLKIFFASGVIAYSTDAEDIGKKNTAAYFTDKVAKGMLYSKVVKKDEPTLEGNFLQVDVVETYVPIMRDGIFQGAFEIYFDITSQNNRLKHLIWEIYAVTAAVSVILVAVILFTYKRAVKHHEECAILGQKLHDAAITDELTGLLNRRGFLVLAEQQLRISNRHHEQLYFFYCDIDNMKWINDTFGHKTGDQALIETAQVLKKTYREADTFSRLGGDEFAALLSCGPASQEEETIIQRFQKNLDALNGESGRRYELQISVGVVKCDMMHLCSIDEMMTQADAKMYQQKSRRKAAGHIAPAPTN
ncbi:MAG: GGDEF domain-containing protein [Thermodesulfobacteriota bacterium]